MIALLCATAPVSALAAGHPRAPPSPPPTAYETLTADVWLSRLLGRFEYEGSANPLLVPNQLDPRGPRPVKGRSDCVNVGSGPGVHCVLNVEWREEWTMGFPVPPHPYLNPSMVLYGMEPGGTRLHYLLVNNKGIAEGGTGVLSGNTATFTTTHHSERGIVTVTRIHAPPDGRYIQMWVSSKDKYGGGESPPVLTLYLRRVSQGGMGEAPAPAPARPSSEK